MKVVNKNIVVTGGGNGMGRELTLKLLSKGARVIAVDINQAGLEETYKMSGKNPMLLTRVLNITDKEAVLEFAEEIIYTLGHIDGIINNAGIIQPFIDLKNLKFEQIDRVMDVNFYGTLYMTKAFLNHLLTRPVGHIVNIASMGGFFPVPGQSSYGASKAAVKLMTEGLYSELLDTKVKVSVVFPGAIATDIKKNSQASDKGITEKDKNSKMLTMPSAAAEQIINGIEKNKYRVFIGKDSKAMNFIYSINPGFATRLVKRVMGSREH
jgi:short-subunit dehydrogenase